MRFNERNWVAKILNINIILPSYILLHPKKSYPVISDATSKAFIILKNSSLVVREYNFL